MADPQDPTPSAKKTPAKAAKKAPAKKAPAKKAPAKKAPPASPRIDTNGQFAAKDAAAQAKATVDAADNPASQDQALLGRFPVQLAAALAIVLLAVLLIRHLRRR